MKPAFSSAEEHLICRSLKTMPFIRVRYAQNRVLFSFLGPGIELGMVDLMPRHECGYHSD